MKGKRHTTEQKIRILREADGGRSIVEVSKEHNISEVTFHRWKRQFGQLDVNEAKRMKELRWPPKVGQGGSLNPNQERTIHVQETTSAQCPVQSASWS